MCPLAAVPAPDFTGGSEELHSLGVDAVGGRDFQVEEGRNLFSGRRGRASFRVRICRCVAGGRGPNWSGWSKMGVIRRGSRRGKGGVARWQ